TGCCFFSSRRRHTRFSRDWSSDVCSSDLLILVPACDGDMKQAVELNQAYVPWIVRQYKNGAEIASFCVGAFLLASTGLLDGRKRSEEHTSELQSRENLVCRLLLEKKNERR